MLNNGRGYHRDDADIDRLAVGKTKAVAHQNVVRAGIRRIDVGPGKYARGRVGNFNPIFPPLISKRRRASCINRERESVSRKDLVGRRLRSGKDLWSQAVDRRRILAVNLTDAEGSVKNGYFIQAPYKEARI